VVAEGIPPIPSKLIERIQRWEFIDLASLLSSDQPSDDVMTMAPSGQVLLVASDRQPRRKRIISDAHSWAQAFSIYAAALSKANSTSKEETVGLFAHMATVLRLAKDLGGSQWIQYDKLFRE